MLYAESDAEFPKGWDSWPIHHSGTILGKETTIPTDLPPIVIETMKTYNWINDGKGSAYNLRINPDQTLGDYKDGPTGVLELVDIKALLVTEHLVGEPQYGVFTYDGKDISDAHPSLNPSTCTTCHTGYGDACITGVCTKNKVN
ncbi:hypothetical protein [sulfur-oxidizing endosymbiont of Gigantopelta aegis]|uniref:hypothetical protein n=1 Tax=sulfur-oxidizing endosymbiont of Gigantopelta aegis TaxID=2794934 RepID=UPI0018DBA5AA|nr:hypothetical protein [sulfur-oxidizing endosymbiont of Gigantopelta aegis]